MVSTGELRLVTELNGGSIERFEPTVNKEGQVEYAEAKEFLAHRDGTSIEALNSLAERNILDKEYTTKIYICPSCHTDGLQFITACPSCEDTHTTHTDFFEHEPCGYRGPLEEFEIGNSVEVYYCTECEEETDFSSLNIVQKHLCKGCGDSYDSLDHRLWCIDCLHLCPPENATEQTLYEYKLSEDGRDWYTIQIEARDRLADEFATRGFEVSVDATVQDDEDNSYDIHILAGDELLNQQIVADVHSDVDSENIQYISTVGEALQAKPFILTTKESTLENMSQAANQENVTVLWVDQQGSIKRYESSSDDSRSPGNFIDRLSSVVGYASTKDR